MAKHISLIATHADMKLLNDALIKRGDIEFLSDQPIPGSDQMGKLDSVELDTAMQGGSLFCYLLPKYLRQHVVTKRSSAVKVEILDQYSTLIEFARPYINGSEVRTGSLKYFPQYFSEGAWHSKDAEFCKWADNAYSAIRRLFPKNKEYGANVGPDALRLLETGVLKVIP